MFGDNSVAGRPVGVGIPAGQRSAGQGTPRSLGRIVEMKTFAVEWVDDAGVKHIEPMHSIGGVWHRAANGENYARSLKALNKDSWLVKLIEEQISEQTADAGAVAVPTEDAVDISAATGG